MSGILYNIHVTQAQHVVTKVSHTEAQSYHKQNLSTKNHRRISHNTLRHHKNSSDFIVTQCDTFTVHAPYMAWKRDLLCL